MKRPHGFSTSPTKLLKIETFLVTVLLMTSLFGMVALLSAEPLVKEDYVYYEVEGDREDVLLDQIERVRGTDSFHAQTTWYVRWSYDWQSNLNGCWIVGVRIDVDIEYLLPRWLGLEASQNPDLVDTWNRYKEALIFHEHGHGDVAVEAGRKVETALLEMQSYNNCNSLSADADALAKSIVEHHQVKNDRYDQITDHGVTQGAIFP